jgi:hypothetical protein
VNPIQMENESPGTTAWRNSYGKVDATLRSQGVEGYCSRLSVPVGETIEIMAHSATAYFLDVYRMGFYGGTGARHMRQIGYLPAGQRADPPTDDHQLRECTWPTSIILSIPEDWVSGVYLGRLTQVDVPTPTQSYVIFIVTDTRPCDFLFKCSDLTWAAYNGWPDNFSLYNYHGPGQQSSIYWGPRVSASLDRPYKMPYNSDVGGSYYPYDDVRKYAWMVGASQFLTFEFPLLFWMESQGYDVSYISSVDLDETPAPALRTRARALISVGHDEYYTENMFRNLQRAVIADDPIAQNGLSAAFFCAGSVTGALAMSASVARPGDSKRIIQREGRWGPIEPWLLLQQPEQAEFVRKFPDSADLLGARLVDPGAGSGDWVCRHTNGPIASQIYRDTGLRDGGRIAHLIGHEYVADPAPIPGLEVLAQGETTGYDGETINPSQYTATIYPGGKENYVFNASTMWWPHWLNSDPVTPYPPGYGPTFVWGGVPVMPRLADMYMVQKMTSNIFALMTR